MHPERQHGHPFRHSEGHPGRRSRLNAIEIAVAS